MSNGFQQFRTRIIDTVDIQQLVAERVELRRQGTRWAGRGPFQNEKTGSFGVNPACRSSIASAAASAAMSSTS